MKYFNSTIWLLVLLACCIIPRSIGHGTMSNATTEKPAGSTQPPLPEDIEEDDDDGNGHDIKEVDEIPAFSAGQDDSFNPQYGHDPRHQHPGYGAADSHGGDDQSNHEPSCSDGQYMCRKQNPEQTHVRCIPNEWKCNGIRDCEENDDEEQCDGSRSGGNSMHYGGGHDRQQHNQQSGQHDGQQQCQPGQHLCHATGMHGVPARCLDRQQVCDRRPDCPYGDDERECPEDGQNQQGGMYDPRMQYHYQHQQQQQHPGQQYPGHPGMNSEQHRGQQYPGQPGQPGYPGNQSGHEHGPGCAGGACSRDGHQPSDPGRYPGQPGQPGQPGYPGQPGQPGYPGQQGQQGYPGHPGQPGYPGSQSGHEHGPGCTDGACSRDGHQSSSDPSSSSYPGRQPGYSGSSPGGDKRGPGGSMGYPGSQGGPNSSGGRPGGPGGPGGAPSRSSDNNECRGGRSAEYVKRLEFLDRCYRSCMRQHL